VEDDRKTGCPAGLLGRIVKLARFDANSKTGDIPHQPNGGFGMTSILKTIVAIATIAAVATLITHNTQLRQLGPLKQLRQLQLNIAPKYE